MLSLLREFDYCNISACKLTETYKLPKMDHAIKMFVNSTKQIKSTVWKEGLRVHLANTQTVTN